MLVAVIITMCLNGACIERTVTNEASFASCSGPMALQVLPAWMEEQGYTARGYRLAKWSCVIGGKRTGI